MSNDRLELLDKALNRASSAVDDLIFAWKQCLPPERLAVLRELEARNIRLGAHLFPLTGGPWAAQFTASDSAGGLQMLDVVEQLAPPGAAH